MRELGEAVHAVVHVRVRENLSDGLVRKVLESEALTMGPLHCQEAMLAVTISLLF